MEAGELPGYTTGLPVEESVQPAILSGVPTPAGYPGGPDQPLIPPTAVGLENQAEAQPILTMASMNESALTFAAALAGGKGAWEARVRKAMQEGHWASKKQRVMSFL